MTPAYREAMNDVLTLYEKPYSSDEPVVCCDEKSLQLFGEKREPRPMRPGMPFRRDVEPKVGRHLTGLHTHRKAGDFAEFLAWLAEQYPNTRTIHLVMDNLNTHRQASLEKHFGVERGKEIWNRFTPHYTPVHGSWLNQAEIEIGLIARQCLKHRRIATLGELREELQAWNLRANQQRVKINWTFTAKKASAAFANKRGN